MNKQEFIALYKNGHPLYEVNSFLTMNQDEMLEAAIFSAGMLLIHDHDGGDSQYIHRISRHLAFMAKDRPFIIKTPGLNIMAWCSKDRDGNATNYEISDFVKLVPYWKLNKINKDANKPSGISDKELGRIYDTLVFSDTAIETDELFDDIKESIYIAGGALHEGFKDRYMERVIALGVIFLSWCHMKRTRAGVLRFHLEDNTIKQKKEGDFKLVISKDAIETMLHEFPEPGDVGIYSTENPDEKGDFEKFVKDGTITRVCESYIHEDGKSVLKETRATRKPDKMN